MAACREALDDGKKWSFYLINDSAFALEWAVLHEISLMGRHGEPKPPTRMSRRSRNGAHTLVWLADGSVADCVWISGACMRGR